MITLIVVGILVVAVAVGGALVYRNNKAKGDALIDKGENLISKK
jgi:hypothetical protein